ncbi:MAG: hypothetical protein IKX20_06530 [Paludibacteraceae bacterium]|nr:hypothetical protein [Paludibacteraceae bacterium]
MKRKRLVAGFLVMVCLIISTACGKKDHLQLNGIVTKMLAEEKVQHSFVVSLGEYDSFMVRLQTPQVTAEEYDANYAEESEGCDELTDEFVKNEFGFDSVAEYRKDVDEKYLEHLKILRILSARKEIINHLLDIAEFDLNEDDITEFAKQMVFKEQNYSVLYGYVNFNDYLTEELQITEDQFLQKCYDEAREQIKVYLLIGTIAEQNHIDIPETEDIREAYQELENKVYGLFMEIDPDF